jgi:Lrp/AsnC family transcriptional regulator, leucine-responsive regulatory protein
MWVIASLRRRLRLILKVRTEGAQALEDFLARIYAVEGVRRTRSYVVLSSHVERGPRPA